MIDTDSWWKQLHHHIDKNRNIKGAGTALEDMTTIKSWEG